MSENFWDFITVAQAAELSGLSRSTIRRWLREGRLIGEKEGREWYVDRLSLALTYTARQMRNASRIFLEESAKEILAGCF